MNTKILTPFIIIILLLIAGYSSAYAVTHQISKGKTYRSFHVIKNKNVKTLSANKSTDGNLSTNNNRFELGVGNSLILMFVKTYNYKKNGMENTIKANFIDIHLSAGFRFLQYYKIDFRFGYYLVYENFGGPNEGIFLQRYLFNTNIYGIAGIDFFKNIGNSHNSAESGGNFIFTCLGLGYNGTKNFSLEMIYWIPNKKVFGTNYVFGTNGSVSYYNMINNGLLGIGFQWSFIF